MRRDIHYDSTTQSNRDEFKQDVECNDKITGISNRKVIIRV